MFKFILSQIAAFQDSRDAARRDAIKAAYAARKAARQAQEQQAQGYAVAAWNDAAYRNGNGLATK